MYQNSRRIAACRQCAAWVDLNQRDGTCRRHAPQAGDTPDEVAHWPLTHTDDWCGEGLAATSTVQHEVRCEACVYWRRPPDGLFPYGRRDQLSEWWRHAGHCTRFSPLPLPVPGVRAFWRVTHATDGCFDGEAKQS